MQLLIKLVLILSSVFFSTDLFAIFHPQAPVATTHNGKYAPSTLDPEVYNLAVKAYGCAEKKGKIKNDDVMTIIDYSKPSTEKRLWVVDMDHNKVELQEFVSHGSGSGKKMATHFSDRNGSHESSIGVFVTDPKPYIGKHGTALRMRGLEPGFNSHAHSRAIVFHGANYATENFARRMGYLGRSWGCPALDPKLTKETINDIKGGSLVFAYYPDQKWLSKSEYLHC